MRRLLLALALLALAALPARADPTTQLWLGGALNCLVSSSCPLPVQLEGGSSAIGTVNQGSPPWSVSQSGAPWTVTLPDLEGALAPGTAPAKGLPVLCLYNTSLPAPANGQTVACQSDASGRLIVSVGAGSLLAQRQGWTGTTWENTADNLDTGALVTLSNASAGVNSSDQTNTAGRGLKCLIDITAISGTSPTLTASIDYKDTASGTYTHLLTSAALSAAGTTMLTLYPGIAATANVAASDVLPRTWRVSDTISGTTPSVSATIGCSVIR